MTLTQAIILAIVEGLTEYLPISSTGHIIVASSFLGINELPFTKDYTVMVQFGAILAVLVLYWRRFLTSFKFYQKLLAAFVPAAVIGLAIKNHIDDLLGNVTIVAFSFIIGGVILIFADRCFHQSESGGKDVEHVTYPDAVAIGLSQCIAFIPGASRSAFTILGGLSRKLSRRTAAEFSFFLAVPTLTGATVLKALKIYKTIDPSQIQNLLVGNIVSFVVGAITIYTFIGFLSRHGFKWFGYYRIIFGVVLLLMSWAGFKMHVI